MLNVVMLSVVMLSVVAPVGEHERYVRALLASVQLGQTL